MKFLGFRDSCTLEFSVIGFFGSINITFRPFRFVSEPPREITFLLMTLLL